MLEPIQHAIHRAYIYYLVLFIVLIGASVFCFIATSKKTNMIIYGMALVIMAIVIFVSSFLPFFVDCSKSDILVAECVYINSVGDKSKTPSSVMGIYSVKLLIGSQTLNVSTVPLSRSYFPTGEHVVRAYYTKNSKRLLYIEILD